MSWHLRAFFDPWSLPARGDPSLPFPGSDLTPVWFPWLLATRDAILQHGTLPFWNPFANAGSPQFEVPEAGVLALPTLLALVLPAEAAIKWAMLAYVAIGMTGTRALARDLGVSSAAAALAAFAFGTGTYLLDHLRAGHLSHLQPMTLAPWVLVHAARALPLRAGREEWIRSAIRAGVLVGLQVLSGGTSVFVYCSLAYALAALACLGPGLAARLQRGVGVAVVAGACAFATAAPQLLPMLDYMERTGRAGGLSLADSSMAIAEVAHPLPTMLAAVLAVLGLATLVARKRGGMALWLGAVAALGLVAASEPRAYAFLWEHVPGFRYQRIPERALVLVGIAMPVLVGAGLDGAWSLLARWRPVAAVFLGAVTTAFVLQSWELAPPAPPMADPRIERSSNATMQWLAAHDDDSRMHVWESTSRHWGVEHVTVPLGLREITSYTPSEHPDYLPGDFDQRGHRTFVGESYRQPGAAARLWGLLHVEHVVASAARSAPGLELVATTTPCPVSTCQPSKSAGPWIYANREAMPHAWIVPHAIVLVGESRRTFEAALDAITLAEFDPRRTVVLQVLKGDPVPDADAAFSLEGDDPQLPAWSIEAARDAFRRFDAADTEGNATTAGEARPAKAEPPAANTAAVASRGPNRLEVTAPVGGWLVVSERLGLFPGWTATTPDGAARIVRADAVLGALRVQAGQQLLLRYEPPYLRAGLGAFACMIVGIVGWELRVRRRRDRPEAAVAAGSLPRN